jgi:putative phosphoesterase
MNVLVFSDSHGRADKINEALSRQISKPDAIVFLGDGLRDLDAINADGVPVHAVCGNCDNHFVAMLAHAYDEQVIFIGGKRIFITHGHNYHVKSVLSPLLLRARELCCDIVLFGHTHQGFEMVLGRDNEYGIELDKSLYVMNPGSIGSYPYYFGSIEIDREGRVLTSHGSLK